MRPYIKHPRARISSWSVPALCKAYSWPTGLAGGGTIGIVELGGGWVMSDILKFCTDNGLPTPPNNIVDVSVDGTTNSPGVDQDADMEVALDIQVSMASYACATGHQPNLRVYWTQDITTGITAAARDGCDVFSISWGADEAEWAFFQKNELKVAMAAAQAAKMIVFAASGDNDSSDGGPTPANVDLPASCPSVIGCGGTSKTESAEVVWDNNPGNPDGSGTGGGYSTFYLPLGTWQRNAPAGPVGTGRMVPDVAANADPNVGYEIVYGGQTQIVGGTSAVAPLYAGLFAAFGKKLGPVHWTLWQNAQCFNDITSGNNGVYSAAVGPDPCSGLGSPIGSKLAGLFHAK